MAKLDERGRVTRSLVAFAVLGLLAGCGGGSDTANASKNSADTAKDAKALASLVIIDRDTSVRPVGTAAYRGGNEGEGLGVGDSIQTSSTGFAEVAFFDGSLTRVDRSGEFTLTALSDVAGARRVEGSLVGGRAWNRVTKATGSSDQFEIDTPVASATVRGTAFATDCTTIDVCVFTVIEGIVEITPIGGTPVLVTAPAQLTVRRNTTPSAPTPVDATTINNDPWIAKNTTRDTATGKAPPTTAAVSTTTTPPATTTTSATTTTTARPTATPPATTVAPPPSPPPTTIPTPNLSGTWNYAVSDATVVQSSGCYSTASVVQRTPGVFAVGNLGVGCGAGLVFSPRSQNPVLVLSCTSTTCNETLPGNAAGWRPLRLNLAVDGSVTHDNFDYEGTGCELGVPVDSSVRVRADGNRLLYQQVLAICSIQAGSITIGWQVALTRG